MEKFNVIIIGGGPAGATCALRLANEGLRILLIDRYTFPRDKICGDALSVDVLNQLPLVSAETSALLAQSDAKISSWGVSIFSPEGKSLDIPFIYKGEPRAGLICRRMDFDHFIFQQVKSKWQIHVLEDCLVNEVIYGHSYIKIQSTKGNFAADMVVGADGANSVVRRCFRPVAIDRLHYSAGLRVYYEGVKLLHEQNFIELHFFNETLPGYLWIFPLSGGMVNVGIGLLSSEISKRKINLKELLDTLLKKHPALRNRFADAKALEKYQGFGLPLGNDKRPVSGERYLLLGDAAGLIDPFSGEGIGNAIRSGRVAADHIIQNFENQNFSEDFNRLYDKEIYKRMGKEFRISRALQKMCNYPFLFNYVVRQAEKRPALKKFFIEALADVEMKKKLLQPGFYYKVIFKKN